MRDVDESQNRRIISVVWLWAIISHKLEVMHQFYLENYLLAVAYIVLLVVSYYALEKRKLFKEEIHSSD